MICKHCQLHLEAQQLIEEVLGSATTKPSLEKDDFDKLLAQFKNNDYSFMRSDSIENFVQYKCRVKNS